MEAALFQLLSTFFSIQTIVFVIIIYLATASFRKIVEAIAPKIAKIFPDKYETWWVDFWEEWVLLAAPSIIGGLIAFFVTGYPYPEVFVNSSTGRMFFGVIAGLICNNAYKFLKKKLNQLFKIRVKEEESRILDDE